MLSPPRDARNVIGWYTGTLDGFVELAHQTSDLSCPHNLLPKGCDPCLMLNTRVQGDVGSDLPS